MKTKNDGGPAFGHGDPTHGGDPGMTLRDWFAGTAHPDSLGISDEMSMGVAAASAGVTTEDYDPQKHWPEIVAKARYIYADAMLKAREEPTP